MIDLTKNDKEIILSVNEPRPVNLSIGQFVVKSDSEKKGIYEVIAKNIAMIMNIKCPNYYITEINGEQYILSEDLNQYGKFQSAFDLYAGIKDDYFAYSMADLYKDESFYDEDAKKSLHGNSLYDIWAYLEENYDSNTSKRLMQDVLKIYIFDILFLNSDRFLNNWGFLKTPDNKSNIVMFDNEYILALACENHKTKEESDENKTIKIQTNFLVSNPNVYEDFRVFLRESSEEQTNLFSHYIRLFTPSFFKMIIAESETNSGVILDNKDNIIETYKNHHEQLVGILNEELSKEEHHGR